MSKDDPELVDLLQFLLAQQRDILHTKAHLFALEQVVYEIVGPERTARLNQEVEELQRSDVFRGTHAVITALEEMLAQSLPTNDTKH